MRINGDSPLIDPALIDRGVRIFLDKPCDLVTNILTRTFPKGQSVEVIKLSALHLANSLAKTAHEVEHVTQFFIQITVGFQSGLSQTELLLKRFSYQLIRRRIFGQLSTYCAGMANL